MDRRSFLVTGFREYLKEFVGEVDASFLAREEPKKNDYFESVFSCYPLLSEAPYYLLVDAAEKLGINTENKSKLELAREIFSREDVIHGAGNQTS